MISYAMTRSMYVLLALFLQGSPQSLATMQCGSDQTALVQKNPKVQVPQGALEQEATGACVDTSFDSGTCGDNTCRGCNPQGEVLIPTNPAGFPSPGSLTCGLQACIWFVKDLGLAGIFRPRTLRLRAALVPPAAVRRPSSCAGIGPVTSAAAEDLLAARSA